MNDEKVVLDGDDMRRTLVRIAHEIVEKQIEPRELAIVGIHRRGAILARRLRDAARRAARASRSRWATSTSASTATTSAAAPTRRSSTPRTSTSTSTARTVVIVDDVLYTGRTVRAAIEALFDYGRPGTVQLAVLADRGHRELPIRPDYVGKNLPTSRAERVNVRVEELDGDDEVTITALEEVLTR